MDASKFLITIFQQVLQNTLWASALGILLALVWRWLPGWGRYGLGLMVAGRLMMPALPVSPLSAANWWRERGEDIVKARPQEIKAALPGKFQVVENLTGVEFRADVPASSFPFRSMERAAVLWLAGVVFLGLRLGRRQRVFNRWWKARRVPASALWEASLADCLEARPRVRRVRIWQIAGLGSPLACGIFRPCILVPPGLDQQLQPSERAHVLRHELAHHLHHDLAWNLLFATASCVHWFNPLVHTGFSRLLRQREIQRDADAVRACPRQEAAGYGPTLLKLVTLLPQRGAPAPVSSAMLGIHHLKQRLTMIPQHSQPARPAARLAFTAAAAVLAVLTFTRADDKSPGQDKTPSAAEQKPEDSAALRERQTIVFKLNNIVIPRIEFMDTPVKEVLSYLRAQSIENDKLTTGTEKKGIDIIQKGEGKERITCDLRQTGLLDAIKDVCAISDYCYRLEPNAVVVMRKDQVDRSLITKIFRINEEVAKAMGWQPGTDKPFSETLTSHYGIEFPEGAATSLNLDTGRLVARLPMDQLDLLEAILDTCWHENPVCAFEITGLGVKKADDEGARTLTEEEFTDLLKTVFHRNPATIIRLQAGREIVFSKVTAAMESVRAAGFKSMNFQIREEPSAALLPPAAGKN